MSEVCKFDELRMKTTRQLIQVMNREIERGTRALAEGRFLKAKRACADVSRFVSLLSEVPDAERGPLESRVREFQKLFEETDISALARALWVGRGCPEGSPEEDWLRAERVLKSHEEFETAAAIA